MARGSASLKFGVRERDAMRKNLKGEQGTENASQDYNI